MGKVFSVQDRQAVFEFIRSIAAECDRIVALVQVGSGANGFHDEHSDLDFVVALDSGKSMPEVMEYIHREISAKYELAFFTQDESRHLQNYILSDLLE
ncbi:nucleotidyltransferase domain-containing protein, partial [Vibrio sp. FNV 38]|nr:nucleotidyltransferase domain-containing protein [Vibrio sp. FNV 38]